MRTCLTFLVTAIVFGLAVRTAVRADEETPPAAQYVAHVAKLPAPSEAAGFAWEGTMSMAGNPIGKMVLKAVPAEGPDGVQVWVVEERMLSGDGDFSREAETVLDRTLTPVKGRVRSNHPQQGRLDLSWTRVEGGFDVTSKVAREGAQPIEKTETLAHEGPTSATFSSVILFCRLTLPQTGRYEVQVFEPDPSPGDGSFETAAWHVEGQGDWKGTKAWLVKGVKGRYEMQMGLAVEGRAFLGSRFEDTRTGAVWAFEPQPEAAADPESPAEAPEKPKGPLDGPAKSAKVAAMQAGLAFATGDLDLVEKVIHWPSVYEVAKADHVTKTMDQEDAEPFPELGAYKDLVLAGMKKSLPNNPRAMIEPALKMVEGVLKEEPLDGGITRVVFPPLFKNLTLDVAEIDGIWRLVRMPISKG